MKEKRSRWNNAADKAVIESADAETMRCALLMQQEQLNVVVLNKLGITNYPRPTSTVGGNSCVATRKHRCGEDRLVGKYVELPDAYRASRKPWGTEARRTRPRWSAGFTVRSSEECVHLVGWALVAPGFGHRG